MARQLRGTETGVTPASMACGRNSVAAAKDCLATASYGGPGAQERRRLAPVLERLVADGIPVSVDSECRL